MAVTANIQKLVDGPRNLVVRLSATMLSATDSETLVKKIDVTTLSSDSGSGPLAQKPLHLVLKRTLYSTQNMNVKLFWEGTPNLFLTVFPANYSGEITHDDLYGGIYNNALASTGNVLLSTGIINTTAPTDAQYDLTLWFRKKYS